MVKKWGESGWKGLRGCGKVEGIGGGGCYLGLSRVSVSKVYIQGIDFTLSPIIGREMALYHYCNWLLHIQLNACGLTFIQLLNYKGDLFRYLF